MTYSTPYFKAYRTTGGTAEITNIQDMTFGKGRQYVTDNYRAGTGDLRGRRPDLLPTLAVGDTIRLDVGIDGASFASVYYRLSNLQITYGIVSSMDTWSLQLEDAFAVAGRAQITTTWPASTNAYDAFGTICTLAGITASGTGAAQTVSAQSFTNSNALQIVQNIANTAQAYLTADDVNLRWSNSNWPYSAITINFADYIGVNLIQYDNLTFGSLVDNYATKVIVSATGLADSTSGTGNLSYSLDTYASSTSDATAIAQFVAGNLAANTASPLQISCTIKEQSNTDMFAPLNAPYLATVSFRGTTYSCYVLGFQMSGTPQDIRGTYYLASASFLSQFILNSSTNGVLNTNKLGF